MIIGFAIDDVQSVSSIKPFRFSTDLLVAEDEEDDEDEEDCDGGKSHTNTDTNDINNWNYVMDIMLLLFSLLFWQQ